MDKCEEYLVYMSLSLDGELSPEEEAQLQAHLETCETCRKEMEALRQLRNDLSEMEAKPPEALRRRVMEMTKSATPDPKRSVISRIAAIAAILVVLVFAGYTTGFFTMFNGASDGNGVDMANLDATPYGTVQIDDQRILDYWAYIVVQGPAPEMEGARVVLDSGDSLQVEVPRDQLAAYLAQCTVLEEQYYDNDSDTALVVVELD